MEWNGDDRCDGPGSHYGDPGGQHSGPIPIDEGRAMMLEMALCDGGRLHIPVERAMPAQPATTPCRAKVCQSRNRSTPFDPEQGRDD